MSTLSPPDASSIPPPKEDEEEDPPYEISLLTGKRKVIRGQRACLACRNIKMKCVNAEFPPCVRCTRSGEECIFTESRRGKQPKKRKVDPLTGAPIARVSRKPSISSSATTAAGLLNEMRNALPPLPPPRPKSPSTGSSPYPFASGSGGRGYPLSYSSTSAFTPTTAGYTKQELPLILGRDPRLPPTAPPPPPSSSYSLPTPSSYSNPTPSSYTPSLPTPTSYTPSLPTPTSYTNNPTPPLSQTPSTPSETLALKPLSTEHPLGVLAEASKSPLIVSVGLGGVGLREEEGVDGKNDVGIASRGYFVTGGGSGGESGGRGRGRPEAEGLLGGETVGELFELFYEHLHVHSPTVDREVCTPEFLAGQSHTLFNAICCLSARYHPTKPHLTTILHDLAQKELSTFPSEKTLECVQAQILYCGYALIPAETFETDLTWLRVGMALRLAVDLNLHRAGQGGVGEKVIPEWRLNSMRRTWLICTVLDRTTSAQLGKPTLLWSQNTHGAFSESPSDSPDARRIYAQVELSEIVAKSLDALRREVEKRDKDEEGLPEVSIRFERMLEDWKEKWIDRVKWGLTDEHHQVRQARIRLSFHNAQLLFASIALQRALHEDEEYAPFALAKYQTAALAILRTFKDDMVSTGLAKYCTDFHFGSVLYAAVSLLKSVQTQFRHCLVDKITAGKLINTTADGLEDAACRWDHLPNLQSRFLRRVLKARLPEYIPPPRTVTSKVKELPPLAASATSTWENFNFDSHHTRLGAVDEQFEPSIFNFDFNSAPTEGENEFFDSTRIDPKEFPDWFGTSMGGMLSARSSRAPSRVHSRAASPSFYENC